MILGRPGMGKPDYDYAQNVEVQAYEFGAATGKESVEVDVPAGKGTQIVGKIRVVKGEGEGGAWRVEVVNGDVRLGNQTFLNEKREV